MKTDIFRFFNQRPDIKFNRKVFVFLICLAISSFTWLQINLSKEHTDNVAVRVEFTNLPKAKFGATRLVDTILMEVESSGFALMKYEMKDVSIDSRKLRKDAASGGFYFLPNNYTKTIGKQLGDNIKVIRAVSDTIQLTPKSRS